MTHILLTPQKAYSILKSKFPEKVVKGCVDFPAFYAFYMVKKEFAQEKLISTQFVDAVDKKTGRVFDYDIFSDMSAYRNARNVDVRLLK